jgi:hypothetical protein
MQRFTCSCFFILLARGVETCVEYHTAFTDADNDLVVPSGAKAIHFAYTKPSKQVFNFELGSAGATSRFCCDQYQASRAFIVSNEEGNYIKWQSNDQSGLTYEDGLGIHQVGKHQSIFFRFNQPQIVVRIAFGTYSVWGGPSKFSVFASNAQNCLDESQWTILKVVNDNKRFPGKNWWSDGMRVKNLPKIGLFQCYGIQVRQIPGRCEMDPVTSKLILQRRGNRATIKGIQMWSMGKSKKFNISLTHV